MGVFPSRKSYVEQIFTLKELDEKTMMETERLCRDYGLGKGVGQGEQGSFMVVSNNG